MPPADFRKGFSSFKNDYSGSSQNDDRQYNELVSSITQGIQSISGNYNSYKLLVDAIGSERETPGMFDDLLRRQQTINDLAHKIGDQLRRLTSFEAKNDQEQVHRQMQLEKIKDNFSAILKNFQLLQRTAAVKEKAAMNQAMSSYNNLRDNQQTPLIEGLDAPGDTGNVQSEMQLRIEEIQNREKAIKKLEQDIVGVNDIFRDLSTMIHEQGEVIDSIEANVESAALRVESAGVQLTKARALQNKSRKKMIIFVVILVIIIIILALIIYFSTKKS